MKSFKQHMKEYYIPESASEGNVTFRKSYSSEEAKEVAKLHGVDLTKYDLEEFRMGLEVEQEHTAREADYVKITLDHLRELPDYYTRLEKMESE